jgi:hypothetical protein
MAFDKRFWNFTRDLVKQAGFDPSRLPAEAVPQKMVGEYAMYIKARNPKGAKQHRVFINCTCGEQVPSGRMHQHVRGRFHNSMTK